MNPSGPLKLLTAQLYFDEMGNPTKMPDPAARHFMTFDAA
jgi:hypothetical protein